MILFEPLILLHHRCGFGAHTITLFMDNLADEGLNQRDMSTGGLSPLLTRVGANLDKRYLPR